MAPNFEKVKLFSSHKKEMAPPGYIGKAIEEPTNLETGSFLTETQRNNNVDTNNHGDNPYLDRYRALITMNGCAQASLSDIETPSDWLNTDLRDGLSTLDVERRRKFTGWNELASEKGNMLLNFIGFFRGPVLYVMEVAVIVALGMEDWLDAGIIIGILLLNAVVGWYQEKQAADVVASLKGDIAMKARVVRDGQEQEIWARELVPGRHSHHRGRDVTSPRREKFEEDDEERTPHIGHAIMTDTVFYTTGCKRGKAYGVVTCGAKASCVGKTATLVQGTKDSGHFKAIMDSIGTTLLVLVGFWILVAWIGDFYRNLHIVLPEESSSNLLTYALILLIIGVPVGLPVVTTTTLAVGAAYLAKEKAIVQKLTAIDSLAGVDILCSVKTGTLTANRLSVREPFVMEGVDINWMMAVAALASSHNIKALDPIDKITVLTLKRYPKAKGMISEDWKTDKFTPFDPSPSGSLPSLCTMAAEQEALFKEKATKFSRSGFRSLAVAIQDEDGPWEMLGIISLFDHLRSDTAQTIAEAQALGLSVKMLTGDAIAIAKETCRMLALGTKVYNSDKLLHSDMAGTAMHDLCRRDAPAARSSDSHDWRRVNDAPSLKKSDCGIPVEGATEAAPAAADIVLLAPGLSTIASAIEISRQIFQRMKAHIQYLTSMININETIRADLIVFLALFADLATIAVAYDTAHFEKRPVEWQLPKIWIISVVLGSLLALDTWVLRGTLYPEPRRHPRDHFPPGELLFVTRGFEITQSWQLVSAIFGVDVLATLFAGFSWFSGGAGEPLPGLAVDQALEE
ncbi:Uu.00g056980.m01.CDS01 [Anthostomella pinea]|uniref:Uu.00g056980.m01.CDS01 n=1 Tax=Anthostomella pinea TaxID=933095 RepID=A0AAI8YM03_9PEZI|nr:Uu.00g056980.m01.CDS01 [Anthostomella pinea]